MANPCLIDFMTVVMVDNAHHWKQMTGVTAELIWPLRVAGPVLRGLRSPAALAE